MCRDGSACDIGEDVGLSKAIQTTDAQRDDTSGKKRATEEKSNDTSEEGRMAFEAKVHVPNKKTS